MKIIVNIFIFTLILSGCGRYQKALWVGEKKKQNNKVEIEDIVDTDES